MPREGAPEAVLRRMNGLSAQSYHKGPCRSCPAPALQRALFTRWPGHGMHSANLHNQRWKPSHSLRNADSGKASRTDSLSWSFVQYTEGLAACSIPDWEISTTPHTLWSKINWHTLNKCILQWEIKQMVIQKPCKKPCFQDMLLRHAGDFYPLKFQESV